MTKGYPIGPLLQTNLAAKSSMSDVLQIAQHAWARYRKRSATHDDFSGAALS
jgi:hypothetical protein